MYKNFLQYLVLGSIAFSLMAFSPAPQGIVTSTGAENSAIPSIETQVTTVLSDAEIASLLKMREEEKLAHDVYVYLSEKWNLNTFANIAASEQTHSDEIKSVLDVYGLVDPSTGKPAGVFSDPELQKLYDSLIQQGSKSLSDAIKVGGAIEEIDILDLRKAASSINAPDIKIVYANLENGSENHLSAFAGTLERQTGETYQPQYMTVEDYQAAIEGGTGNGRNGTGTGTGTGNGIGNGNGMDNGSTGNGLGIGSGMGSNTGNGRRGGRS